MKSLLALGLVFLFPQAAPQTARDYYNEIYKVGGLDRMADERVCFDEDPKLDTFFIFGQSKHMRELMQLDGTFSKLPNSMQDELKKDFLIVRGYDKGVPLDNNDFYSKDGASWVTDTRSIDKSGTQKIRIRLTVNWDTLRYKRSVEVSEHDLAFRSANDHYGRCENVKPDIRQHGGNDN